MKTDWKNKLKAVLAETATAKKSEIYLKTELTKTDKTPIQEVSSVFVSDELADISEKQIFQIEDLTACPVCTIPAKNEQSDALHVTFCPLGCPFLVCRFTENKEAVYQTVKAMFEAMAADELETLQDALRERTSVFMYETGCDYESALERAEQDVLPVYLDKHARRVKFGRREISNF